MTESGGESAKLQESFPYEDIVNLPHHRSETHPHMSMEERAAQFSSFAALTGHKEAVKEKARRTSRRKKDGRQNLRFFIPMTKKAAALMKRYVEF